MKSIKIVDQILERKYWQGTKKYKEEREKVYALRGIIADAIDCRGQHGIHAIIEDGNVQDECIKSALGRAEVESTTEQGVYILNELLKYEVQFRYLIVNSAMDLFHDRKSRKRKKEEKARQSNA